MTTLRATEIYDDPRFRLIAIESVDCSPSKSGAGYFWHGKIEPLAVVVCSPDGVYALDTGARLVTLDKLRQQIPELEAIISSFTRFE